MSNVPQAALHWLMSEHTGLSSMAIFGHMTGAGPHRDGFEPWPYPRDPADLARCVRLLETVPEWRPRIHEMADRGSVWAVFVIHWQELIDMLNSEAPAWRTGTGKAPLTYQLMQELRDGIREGVS